MIIQKQKTFEEICVLLEGRAKVFIFGCADCATACKTGGEPELAEMKAKLEAAGHQVTGTVVCDTACLLGEVRQKVADNQGAIDAADAILVLACGSGTQTIGDYLEQKVVVPGVESLFIGEVIRQGKFEEKCQACGACIIGITGGICPVTRCTKGLVNGPCGGYRDGHCEVDPERDCAWILIYNRLKVRGQLGRLREMQPARDNSVARRPRRLVWETPRPPKKS